MFSQINLLEMTGMFFFSYRNESANDKGMALDVKAKRWAIVVS